MRLVNAFYASEMKAKHRKEDFVRVRKRVGCLSKKLNSQGIFKEFEFHKYLLKYNRLVQ